MNLENLIIGCGPAGLAVAGLMRDSGLPFEVIEASDRIGNAWHQHYDRLHLHTVKKLSHLPLVPFPENFPTYVSRQQLVGYMDKYAGRFKIKPIFNQVVSSLLKEENGWVIHTIDGNELKAKNVILATGVNRLPVSPSWKGQSSFKGSIRHSRYYKNPAPYKDQRALVVGMGNTGAEIALDLSQNGVKTFLSVRSPISVVPRDLNGRPVQTTSKQLAKLPFGLGDWLGSQIRKVYFGNIEKYGLTVSKMHPAVQLRETGKTPIVDIGTIDAIKKGKILVKHEIGHLTEHEVVFKDGSALGIDHIILATGYKAGLEEFIDGIEDNLDRYGVPLGPIGQEKWKGLFFVGFDNYKLGGILGTINTDARLIVDHIKSQQIQ